MQRFDWCSEDDPFDGPNDRIYFPARVSRRKPSWSSSAPGAYVGLLGEVYAALHADSRRLAMMGARALIDSVITRSVGEQKTFALGLEELHKQEFIATKERKVIEAAVEAGHAAMHRGHQPTAEDVNVVIDIVERMIHAEILKAQADALKASTPPRKTQSATKKT